MKTTWVAFFLCLFSLFLQASEENEEDFSLLLDLETRGQNIPVAYSGTGTTTSLGFMQLQVSTSGADCGSVSNWVQGGGDFPVNSGASTLYLNSSADWTNNRSIAKGLCPGGTTSQYMKLLQVKNQAGTSCVVDANCFTKACSATGTVTMAAATGTLPTVTCP